MLPRRGPSIWTQRRSKTPNHAAPRSQSYAIGRTACTGQAIASGAMGKTLTTLSDAVAPPSIPGSPWVCLSFNTATHRTTRSMNCRDLINSTLFARYLLGVQSQGYQLSGKFQQKNKLEQHMTRKREKSEEEKGDQLIVDFHRNGGTVNHL